MNSYVENCQELCRKEDLLACRLEHKYFKWWIKMFMYRVIEDSTSSFLNISLKKRKVIYISFRYYCQSLVIAKVGWTWQKFDTLIRAMLCRCSLATSTPSGGNSFAKWHGSLKCTRLRSFTEPSPESEIWTRIFNLNLNVQIENSYFVIVHHEAIEAIVSRMHMQIPATMLLTIWLMKLSLDSWTVWQAELFALKYS